MMAATSQNNDLAGHGATPEGVQVLHADDSLLVLNKPAGLLSVPGKGEDKQDCLSTRVQQLYPDALVVHRLDMATSGLLLMARSRAAQRSLSQAFAERQVHKAYEAVVQGQLAPPEPSDDGWGLIDLPIVVDWPRRPLRVIDALLGKPSKTRWRIQHYDAAADHTRLRLEPVTGRSHQLRVHLQALGHPILGDQLYAPALVQARAERLLLHACSLRLSHPVSGVLLQFESAAPF
ncbi:RluA family pseudouridine synthase [Polaromonas sp. UC242_47]|uniref:RluA family pseudouridine synthase n=1 Tax=Polaromonas sp. UC242_47 TaxID=3374626 RepID=UPI0037A76E4D